MLHFGFKHDIAHAVPPPPPEWWKIASLDAADILGVWDFGWSGHGEDRDAAFVPFDGVMSPMAIETGNPGVQENKGINFGGAGCVASMLPDDTLINELSCIVEYSESVDTGTLMALFSHYNTSSHYTLQNSAGFGALRWSCGNGDSTTIEVSPGHGEGVVGVSGTRLYFNGTFLDEVPATPDAAVSNQKFYLGAIMASDITQFVRAKVRRLLLVKRPLTDTEQSEIYANMTGTQVQILDMDRDGKPDTEIARHGNVTISEDEDGINVDIDGDKIADLVVPK